MGERTSRCVFLLDSANGQQGRHGGAGGENSMAMDQSYDLEEQHMCYAECVQALRFELFDATRFYYSFD